MKPWKGVVPAVGIILMLASGCTSSGGGGAAHSASPSSATTLSSGKPFEATVRLSDFSPTCQEVTCWLPTQWQPKLVKGETVGLYNEWPMDGTTVLVLCQTTGETYRDQTGQETNAWYGIFVPADKLEPLKPNTGPKSLPVDNGYIGYVGAAWIDNSQGKQAPHC